MLLAAITLNMNVMEIKIKKLSNEDYFDERKVEHL